MKALNVPLIGSISGVQLQVFGLALVVSFAVLVVVTGLFPATSMVLFFVAAGALFTMGEIPIAKHRPKVRAGYVGFVFGWLGAVLFEAFLGASAYLL